jgi:alpha-mannosidase
VREAYDLNTPLTVASGAARVPEASLLALDAPNVFIDTVKPAEDGSGDVVIRLYEAKRTWTRCKLQTSLPVKRIIETDLLENQLRELDLREGGIAFEIRPFQIITLRMKFL